MESFASGGVKNTEDRGVDLKEATSYLPISELLPRGCFLDVMFQQTGEPDHINETIVLDRRVLDFCAPGHPRRSLCLSRLSSHLGTRYELLRGAVEDLNEAIRLKKDALAPRPPGYPNRPSSLNNLAGGGSAFGTAHSGGWKT